ncbi:MAG: hypothetical protein H6834_01435 [Planctomycetes bacterium]|nr:hypothetical protein [Planctomycetota bacterium]
MREDRATFYSSGVAEFDRAIVVPHGEAKDFRIRVKRDELADLLASFEVRGPVRWVAPPTWDGSGQPPTLTIDPSGALPGLLVQLVGARVELLLADGAASITGELVGLHDEARGGAGDDWSERYVVVLADGQLRRVALADVSGVQILDEAMQKELDRALRQRIEGLRPSSKTLRFSLTSLESSDADARMRYTIPAAAWKISYRLRLDDGRVELAAFAIVDNDGEEDWDNLRVTVVSGEPISFSTDLAEAKRPTRKTVRLVAKEAFGAVEVEEGMVPLAAAAAPGGAHRKMARMRGARFEEVAEDAAGAFAMDDAASDVHAEFTSASSREVGEFQVFETQELVTIRKGESAAIPLFSLELGETKQVLHYKRSEHAERPWRAIDFVHDGDFALGRGVCTVTEGGVFAGNCIIPALKKGGDALLPHALETGVRVRFEDRGTDDRRVGFVFGNGYLVTRIERTRTVVYRVRNARGAAFTCLLDHELAMHDAELECRLIRDDASEELPIESKLSSGYRLRFDLAPREDMLVQVVERAPIQQTIQLTTSGQIEWFFDVFLVQEQRIADLPELRAILASRRELEATRAHRDEKRREHERLVQRQERLRKNIDAMHRHEQADKWRQDLAASEERLTALEEIDLPGLEEKEQAILQTLDRQIEALSLVLDPES